MKKIYAFLLLAAFAVQYFNNAIIVFSFYINQSKIAATLCENRYRPILHCDGKCVLAKKIKQEESKDNQNPERKPANKTEVFSSRSFFPPDMTNLSAALSSYAGHIENEQTGIRAAVFHPPCA